MTDWHEIKQQVLDYIREHSGRYNGSEISYLFSHGIIDLKLIEGHYICYYSELEREGLIRYDEKEQKWFQMSTYKASNTLSLQRHKALLSRQFINSRRRFLISGDTNSMDLGCS